MWTITLNQYGCTVLRTYKCELPKLIFFLSIFLGLHVVNEFSFWRTWQLNYTLHWNESNPPTHTTLCLPLWFTTTFLRSCNKHFTKFLYVSSLDRKHCYIPVCDPALFGRNFCHHLILFSSLSDDRSKASSKTIPQHSAIQSLLFQMRVSSPVLKVIQ